MNLADEAAKHRILIIDDNPSIHEDIRKVLLGTAVNRSSLKEASALLFDDQVTTDVVRGFEIDSAFQGEEGLRKVETAHQTGRPYEVAFVDVRMPPGWDGIETVHRIWSNHPELQVVICTAYSDYSWEERSQRIGESDSLLVLKKPFDNLEVMQLAHALSEKWRLGKENKERLRNLDALVSQRTHELEAANQQLKNEI